MTTKNRELLEIVNGRDADIGDICVETGSFYIVTGDGMRWLTPQSFLLESEFGVGDFDGAFVCNLIDVLGEVMEEFHKKGVYK